MLLLLLLAFLKKEEEKKRFFFVHSLALYLFYFLFLHISICCAYIFIHYTCSQINWSNAMRTYIVSFHNLRSVFSFFLFLFRNEVKSFFFVFIVFFLVFIYFFSIYKLAWVEINAFINATQFNQIIFMMVYLHN